MQPARPDAHDPADDGTARVGLLSQRYGRRVLALLAVGLVAGLAVKKALVPRGFGELGHFRVAAIQEERDREPVLVGKQACASCHPEQFRKHEKDVHVSVQCEVCHGAARDHVSALKGGERVPSKIERQLDAASCLVCHAELRARPVMFPSVDARQHYSFLSVRDPKTRCTACHDPHEPIFLDRRVSEARIHPLIHPCTDCHKDGDVAQKPLPAGHVVTFQCQDCHAEIMADFKSKSHRFFDCTVCHLFHKESEFSGRIFKNGSARFCLLCHLSRPFQDAREMPQIQSVAGHLDQHARSPEDRGKRCTDCHQERRVHALLGRAKAPPADGRRP
jgi:hypothetical protein